MNKKEIFLILILLVIFMVARAQDSAQPATEARLPIADYLTHDVIDVDGMPCVVVYTPLHDGLPDGYYPVISGVSCDWDEYVPEVTHE